MVTPETPSPSDARSLRPQNRKQVQPVTQRGLCVSGKWCQSRSRPSNPEAWAAPAWLSASTLPPAAAALCEFRVPRSCCRLEGFPAKQCQGPLHIQGAPLNPSVHHCPCWKVGIRSASSTGLRWGDAYRQPLAWCVVVWECGVTSLKSTDFGVTAACALTLRCVSLRSHLLSPTERKKRTHLPCGVVVKHRQAV